MSQYWRILKDFHSQKIVIFASFLPHLLESSRVPIADPETTCRNWIKLSIFQDQGILINPSVSVTTDHSSIAPHFVCRTTDIPVLNFWWCLSWVSSPGWMPSLHVSSPVCKGNLRFISSATPSDHWALYPLTFTATKSYQKTNLLVETIVLVNLWFILFFKMHV